jgi:hypothetical protein
MNTIGVDDDEIFVTRASKLTLLTQTMADLYVEAHITKV